MIRSYTFSNFQSFRRPTTVNLVYKKKLGEGRLTTSLSQKEVYLNALSIVGPNASGKTALLKVPTFLVWFMINSFGDLSPESKIPVYPNLADVNNPSKFEMIFMSDGVEWKYVLECTQSRVVREELHRKEVKYSFVFKRKWNADSETYEVQLQNFELPPKLAKRARQNASLISTGIQFNIEIATAIREAFVDKFISNVVTIGKRPNMADQQVERSADFFARNSLEHSRMIELLREWDLGLTNVTIAEKNPSEIDANGHSRWEINAVHELEGKEYLLPFGFESDGTKGLFSLMAQLLPILNNGGVAIIDELETNLHPLMLKQILDLFADRDTNPYGAQLIFSTHSIEVLNSMSRNQILFVEKNSDGESHQFTLESIGGVRDQDNYYLKYLAGAYGAIPKFGSFRFEKSGN